jgi:flagellar hook protein FlgE
MSFQQGLSGLNASSKNLDVIGNNIANASTVGFKMSQAQFADVYAASLSGAGSNSIGIGTKLAAVAQQFTQGNISTTNNPLDVAINGTGLFRMSNNGAISYTRNGQFQMNRDGNIVGNTGLHLTGYQALADGTITGNLGDLKIDTADIDPNSTTRMDITANLDARKAAPITPMLATLAEPIPSTVPPTYVPPDPSMYNDSTSITIYDSLGNDHVATLYFAKDDVDANTWHTYMTVDGGYNTGGTVFQMDDLVFDTNGRMTAPEGPPLGMNSTPIQPWNGQTVDWNSTQGITHYFGKITQFGNNFGATSFTQDGYAAGRLSGFNIDPEGFIQGRYTNGQTKTMGQIAVASFTNLQGLKPLGGNQWVESPESGQPVVGKPGSGSMGVLQSSAVEDSNTDLTQELVGMITAQRVYQANAQTIKTQDQVLQTLVNLR